MTIYLSQIKKKKKNNSRHDTFACGTTWDNLIPSYSSLQPATFA